MQLQRENISSLEAQLQSRLMAQEAMEACVVQLHSELDGAAVQLAQLREEVRKQRGAAGHRTAVCSNQSLCSWRNHVQLIQAGVIFKSGSR